MGALFLSHLLELKYNFVKLGEIKHKASSYQRRTRDWRHLPFLAAADACAGLCRTEGDCVHLLLVFL